MRVTKLLASLMVLGGLAVSQPAGAEPYGEHANQCAHLDGKPVPKNGGRHGFDHVVRVRNTCTRPVTCEVWTNIDAKRKATLDVPAASEAETTLRNSSPVSMFRAKGSCTF